MLKQICHVIEACKAKVYSDLTFCSVFQQTWETKNHIRPPYNMSRFGPLQIQNKNASKCINFETTFDLQKSKMVIISPEVWIFYNNLNLKKCHQPDHSSPLKIGVFVRFRTIWTNNSEIKTSGEILTYLDLWMLKIEVLVQKLCVFAIFSV